MVQSSAVLLPGHTQRVEVPRLASRELFLGYPTLGVVGARPGLLLRNLHQVSIAINVPSQQPTADCLESQRFRTDQLSTIEIHHPYLATV